MEADTCKKELVIEIPVDVVRREAENVTGQYARLARIPGFRPGHAPASIVRRHFRDDIRGEVMQALLPKFFASAVKEQNWSVVGRPRFEEVRFEDDKPLTAKARFEVVPEFELKEYKALEAEEDPPTVTEADVDRAVEDLRQRAATFEVVSDRAAVEGDFMLVNYQGRDLKKPESPPVEVRDALVHLGGQGTVGAFTNSLAGAQPGQVRQFEVTYPEDHPQKTLAGRTFSYRVDVQSIKKKVVPPVDDELAKSTSEFDTLAELRSKLQEDLKERQRLEVAAGARKKLVERLLADNVFPVPEVLVEAQIVRGVERLLMQMMAQGIDPRALDFDWKKVRQETAPEAARKVRATLILEKIAAREKIEVSDAEVDEVIRELAAEKGEPPATLKTRLTEDGEIDRIISTRRSQKALDFVYQNAKITRKNEPEKSREDLGKVS